MDRTTNRYAVCEVYIGDDEAKALGVAFRDEREQAIDLATRHHEWNVKNSYSHDCMFVVRDLDCDEVIFTTNPAMLEANRTAARARLALLSYSV